MSRSIPPHLPAPAARLDQISTGTTGPATAAEHASHGPGSGNDPAAIPARSTNHPRQGSRALLSLLARAHTGALDLAGRHPGSTLAAMVGGGAMAMFGTVLTAEHRNAGKLAAGGTLLTLGGTGLLAGAYAVAANRVRARGEANRNADLELGIVGTEAGSRVASGPGTREDRTNSRATPPASRHVRAPGNAPFVSTQLTAIEEEPEETDAPQQAPVNTSST
ncbi:hypothetical protein [Noviherbaspirillum aridicola]|uniref:Uncharacterized protein n=1 Tax=Noviherbaspirillum aridicola TaxID=2849687 RepID=A0ABQ4QAE3_9BURK|nr:hypothetical protein [Noviherbaspirillum aridicola]GIZ53644.1 hypothetical protein NCCP691_36580 [Noviherbaspirillum aridicola]